MDGNSNDTFFGGKDIGEENDKPNLDIEFETSEPVEVIVSRVIFALLVSVSLVLNLLLVMAVVRRRRTVHLIYILAASMILPDVVFYAKLVAELVNSWGTSVPAWASSNWACGMWQFATHLYPLLYSTLLLAVVYHAFITLFLDYSGGYEEMAKKCFPIIISSLVVLCTLVAAPSGFFGKSKEEEDPGGKTVSHFRQHCDVLVPSLLTADAKMSAEMKNEAAAAYRLVYELVLPYLLPLLLLAFPYVTLLVGLMRSVPAASHSEHATKITVVVTLWLVTSYLMLHVATVLRNVFSVFSIWHRLMSLFDAHDDTRVPRFQTYVHILAYVCTCCWGIVRASLCFKYNYKLRKALGP